jgi:hypothetical protein
VITQSPAAGTRVVDTGAPTIVLRLVRGPYAQLGKAVDVSPYRGTAIRFAGLATVVKPVKPAPKPAAKPATKPKPKLKQKQKPAAHTATKAAARPPAFVVAGAPKEPLDEMTLSARALRLQRWAANRPKTGANVRHWLYQHAWIVTGAGFGWSHGAQALETLIAVDRQLEGRWGIGTKSEAVARAALVRARRRSG